MKQATFAYIASQLLSKSEKENLARIFKAIDKNGDGKLSKEEIFDGYEEFFGKNLDKKDIEQMFDSVDIDKSGFIDYSEFVIASMNEKNLLTNDKLQAAFKMFDKVSIYYKLTIKCRMAVATFLLTRLRKFLALERLLVRRQSMTLSSRLMPTETDRSHSMSSLP